MARQAPIVDATQKSTGHPPIDPTKLTDAELEIVTAPDPARKVTVPVDAPEVNLDDLPELEDAPEINHEAEAAKGEVAPRKLTTLKVSEQEQFEQDHQMVTIRIRRNLVRTKIGDSWYTFAKGTEREVPRWVADWLMEQGYL